MYCVVYRFTLTQPKLGNQQRFIQVWSKITEYLKQECGALGSRLHQLDDGRFFAYAQWPSKAIYDAASDHDPTQEFVKLRLDWAELCEPSEVIFAGEMCSDLLS